MRIDKLLVRRHYEHGDDPTEMVNRVSRQIDEIGDRFLSAAQTSALDQFHIRGLVATPRVTIVDGAGNLSQSTDARGVVSNYSYDALNRVALCTKFDTLRA